VEARPPECYFLAPEYSRSKWVSRAKCTLSSICIVKNFHVKSLLSDLATVCSVVLTVNWQTKSIKSQRKSIKWQKKNHFYRFCMRFGWFSLWIHCPNNRAHSSQLLKQWFHVKFLIVRHVFSLDTCHVRKNQSQICVLSTSAYFTLYITINFSVVSLMKTTDFV
jgi:hypothetical protein